MQTKLSYRIDEFSEATGISRTAIYRLIAAKKLFTRKAGSITLIDADEAQRFIASLPTVTANPAGE